MSKVQNVMKQLWEKVAQKFPDGKYYIRYEGLSDLEYLYQTGFVDTDKFSLSDWISSFQNSKRPEGSYWLTESQWMEKEKFCYSGPIGEPFKPLELREGEWKEADFHNLWKNQILPSFSLEEKKIQETLSINLRKSSSGHIVISQDAKTAMNHLLGHFASPKQLRATNYWEAQKKVGQKTSAGAPSSPKTGFAMGPDTSKTTVDQLSKLLLKK